VQLFFCSFRRELGDCWRRLGTMYTNYSRDPPGAVRSACFQASRQETSS